MKKKKLKRKIKKVSKKKIKKKVFKKKISKDVIKISTQKQKQQFLENKIDESIKEELKNSKNALKAYKFLDEDDEANALLEASNRIAVQRLSYNDHGRIHVRIVTLNALRVFKILLKKKMKTSLMKEKIASEDDVKVVLIFSAFLHDIGLSIARKKHNEFSVILAEPIINRLLSKIYKDKQKLIDLKTTILECVFSHDESVKCISIESSIITLADGLDMTNGRSRIPIKLYADYGIHALSAKSIYFVEILPGEKKSLKVHVMMSDSAGVFQVQKVLGEKIKNSLLKEEIEIDITIKEKDKLKELKNVIF